jgi:2-polyprenyl-6-methoxyphenol hydroxylase-like FAD-dependent oxidoreductase
MRIACVGAGPAGLYFAILAKLRDPLSDITVWEREREGGGRGWGVTFDPSLLRMLYTNDAESARSIEQGTFRWSDEFVNIRGERVVYNGGVDIYNLNRPRLVEILAARARQLGVRIRYDEEISSLSQLPDADLIVGADGVNSRVREEIDGFGTEAHFSQDKYIWLGTDKPFREFGFHFVETECGWMWAASYGIESELSTFVVHCSAQTWAGLGFGAMTAAETLAALQEIYSEQLSGHRLMGQIDKPLSARWQSFRTVTNQRWHHGNVVLLGDSAHTTHFTTGEGTTLAIEDAIALAESLDPHDDLETSLTAYERQRQGKVRHSQGTARLSAEFFANIHRYISLEPRKFAVLVHERRSPLIPLLPPRFYYHAHKAFREAPILRQARPLGRALSHRLREAAMPAENRLRVRQPQIRGRVSSEIPLFH